MVTPENEDTPQALPEPPKKPIEPPSFDPIEPQEPQKSKGWLSTLATFLVVLLILVAKNALPVQSSVRPDMSHSILQLTS